MSDPLDAFNKWCDEIPNYLIANNMNLMNNLVYFDQVLDNYRANFILCDPYQQFTDKFVTITVPNVLSKILDLPTLDPQIYSKIIFILAKYIDIPAQLIIRNIPFYKQYSTIPDNIYILSSNFMKSNTNARKDIQQTVKDYPYSVIKEWLQKSPVIDWDMFHYIIGYFTFIYKYIALDDCLAVIWPIFKSLINCTVENPLIINRSTFHLDLSYLFMLSLETHYFHDVSQLLIRMALIFIKIISDIPFINNLIIFLELCQKKKGVDLIMSKILIDDEFDKFLGSPKTPINILKKSHLAVLNYDKNIIIKTIKAVNITEDDAFSRFTAIYLIFSNSFKNLDTSVRGEVFSSILNGKSCYNQRILLVFLVKLLDEKEELPVQVIDGIIEYLYKFLDLLFYVASEEIKNILFASRLLIFLIKHSNEKNSFIVFTQFSENNPIYLKILKNEDYNQILLKNDLYSFIFYLRCIEMSGSKFTTESIKNIWDQILENHDKLIFFVNSFETNGIMLFTAESIKLFVNLLIHQDLSKLSKLMINLIVDVVYMLDESQKTKAIDKSIRITSFNLLGMDELFKCYLIASNNETFNCVKMHLLNIWNNCDIGISAERNEALSEYMLKNANNDEQFIRCFNFLYDFVVATSNFYLLEDIGYSHLKKQKEILQKKSLKLTIELIQANKNQNESKLETLRGSMNFSPSDLCSVLKNRAKLKFKCKNILNVRYFGKILNSNSTLEMNGITNGSTIQVEYDFIDKMCDDYKYLEFYMPQMLMNCVPIYQKGLDLLHSENLDNNLASSILRFIYYLPISSQLDSLLDASDVISKAINESLNIYERELFLHVLYYSIDDKRIHNMLVQSQFYKTLINVFLDKKLNTSCFKLALSILMKIWPENENDDFINNQLNKFINKIISLMIDKEIKSRKLINICGDTLLTINKYDSYKKIMNDEIKANIMNIVANTQWKIFGKVISQLQNKNEIFNILIPYLDEFSVKEDRHQFFFDAIFSAIDNEAKDIKVLSDFALSHLYNYGKSVFLSLCEFIMTRPELYTLIDIQQFFKYIEENEISPHIFKFINELYQKVPDKQNEISRIVSNYILIELPEYNINEDFTLKKRPLGSGIRNLSNTCYLNSSLQLLFSIKSFRTTLLKDEKLSTDWQKKLQAFFAVKEFGLLPVVDPSDFVNNFSMMGSKINISEQQDAVEFLLSLIDGLPAELSSFFNGSLTNIFSGINYPYSSSNVEKFFCLSLDVDGCESLEISLKRFVQSEIVNDYKVQDLNESITVKKTTLIKDLPKVLLIQLRRFVYNFKTANREKLNSYLSFPLSIDMSEYCIGSNDEKYVLTGFILHSGNADCGHFHYVGYNRELKEWIDYNDSITFLYQIANLEQDAFGSNIASSNDSDSIMRDQCAYILIYEKVENDAANYELKEENLQNHLREAIKFEKIKTRRISCVMSDDFYNLAMNFDDITFLYNYFTKTMLHMNNVERCTAVKDKLQNLMKGNKINSQLVIELLENDKISTVTPIIYIKNDRIIQTWIDFLTFVIRNSESGESYCFVTTFLNCIDIFKDSPSQAKYFAEIGKEILVFPDSLIIAQSQEWNIKFLIVLVRTIQNLMKADNINYVDIDLFFEDLILMAPIIEKNQKELLNSLDAFVSILKPKTQKLYNDLMCALDARI